MLILALEPLLVLVGIQVAGIWINGFQQTIQRAQRDALHVGLFHVIALDSREHFGINGKMPVSIFGGSAFAAHGAEQEHENEASGGGSDKEFNTPGHKVEAQGLSIFSIAWLRPQRRPAPGRSAAW